METTYLIEIRLGRTKWRIKESIAAIARTFHLEEHRELHPHVTIFGPLVLKPGVTEKQFLTILETIAGRYDPFPFLLDGWEKREGMHGTVIAFCVRPSEPLITLTTDVAQALLPISDSMNAWDPQPEKKWFHVTVANHLDPAIAQNVFDRITGTENTTGDGTRPLGLAKRFNAIIMGFVTHRTPAFRPILLDETGLRLTIMKGEHILAEYDFLTKAWITTGHDHHNASWQTTLRGYRQAAGFEVYGDHVKEPDDVFVISDLHLGHANIIRYCSRPFLYSDPAEMDRVLINNWNSVVSPTSRVFHIGDLRYGKGAPPAHHYSGQLTGNITFIEGNHDDKKPGTVKSAYLDCDGLRFFLVHDPANAPPDFDGWIIHGHHHNNNLRTYPFINFKTRRINVSAEVVGYVPFSLREICSLIRHHAATGSQAPVLLRYPHVS